MARIEAATVPIELFFGVLGLLAVILFFVFRSPEERGALLLLAIAAYLLKAVLVPAYYWMLVETGYQGFAYVDSRGYHSNAGDMAYEIANGLPHNSRGWRYKDPAYNVVCAVLYAVFGSSTIIARLFNAVVGTFTLLYVYRIGRLCFDAAVARVAVRLAAFLPFTIFLTINHRKEALVILLATALFYHALVMVMRQRNWPFSIPIIGVGLLAMFFLRGGFVLVYIGLLGMMFFLTQRSLLVGTVASVFVIVGLFAAQFAFPEGERLDVSDNLEALEGRLQKSAFEVESTGGLLNYAKVTSPGEFWKAPIAAFLLILMPFPPNFGTGEAAYTQLLGFAHAVFLIFLPQFFLGLREVFRPDVWRRRVPLVIYAGGFLLLIGALSAGVLRYRETVFPAILVIVAAGVKSKQHFLLSGTIYAGLVGLASFVYLSRFMR